MNKILILLLVFSTGALFPQDKKEKPEEKKDDHDKKAPMKHETGDIQMDPRDVAEGLRAANLRNLRKLKIPSANAGDPEKYKNLYLAYTEASTVFQERKFLDARRKFEENAKSIQGECRAIGEKYKSRYAKLASESSRISVEKKVNIENETLSKDLVLALEKYVANGAEAGSYAEELLPTINSCDAIYFYKQAINNFIMVQYTLNRDKSRSLSVPEKLAKNLLIDDDYIPAEYLKDYDDSMDLVSATRDKGRERERELVKKMIENKHGENKTSPKNEQKKKTENAAPTEKEPKEIKNDAPKEKPAETPAKK